MTPTLRDDSIHSPSAISPTSYYHANRNGLSTISSTYREPRVTPSYSSMSDYSSKPPLSSSVVVSGNAIVDHIRQQDRMRATREANTGRGSNSSLDRVGLSTPLSSSSAAFSNGDSSYSRSRPILGPSRAYSSSSDGRKSILDPSDVLKPIAKGYDRLNGHSRTPSFSERESLYDYTTDPRRARSSLNRVYSRESSLERSRDVKGSSNGRLGRKTIPDSEDDDVVSVSSSIRLRPSSSASVNLPPRSSVVRQSSNGYTSSSQNYDKPYYQPLQRSDSRSSLINGARDTPNLPSSASNDRLSRFNSVTSSPRYSRGSLKDLSVNFDLSNVTKRDPSPAVLVSRVAIEREIPIRIEREDVEKRYVMSKFPVEMNDEVAKAVPVAAAPHKIRDRDSSMERTRPAVFISRGKEPVKESPVSNGYARQESRDRVIGGKAFASDSSLGTSSGSDDEVTTKYSNSIIRAMSPPFVKRAVPSLKKASGFSVDESEKAGLIGLKNLGNTCFMNSIVQCLSNTQPLRDYCLTTQYESEVNSTSSQMKGSLISAFAAVLEAVWKRSTGYSTSAPFAPDRFHRQLQQYAPRFSGYQQQDAQEFLRYLLEGLHEEVNRVATKSPPETTEIPEQLNDTQKATESWKRYLKRDDSKVVDLFVGQLKSSLICESCGYCSVTYDPFWDLSLPIPGSRGARSTYSSPSSTTIDECFKLFVREETLEGDESPTCCHCKTKQKCRKFFTIQRFPKFLVIHLKRFSQERYRAKLSTLVDYPVEGLDLSPFAADTQLGPRPIYNLYALACHSGSTHCGHYIGFCKHPVTGKWHEYNDARVTEAKMDDLVTPEAYLLFYELVS